MKVTLYNAVSIDGFIAKADGDSDWISEVDEKPFEQEISKAGCIVVGRKTYEQYLGEPYPISGVTNIVITNDEAKLGESDNVIFTNSSPAEVLEIAKSKGHESVLLLGGGETNSSFLKAGLIDFVMFSIHPLMFGRGISPFGSDNVDVDLELIDSKELGEGVVQNIYKVAK